MIYLDNAATTPLRPQARAAMEPFLGDEFGNPSGVHATARAARNALEDARERAAALLGAERPSEIVFTGGGTEADNLAVLGAALSGAGRRRIVVSAVEHEAVLEAARFATRFGCEVLIVPVDRDGLVDPGEVADRVEAGTVVSVMAANNETGATQPVAKIAAAARAAAPDVVVHTDAVQAFVTRPVTVAETEADLIALAGHKFGGPKGVGLLYVRDGIALEPVLHGGGQELGRRSGTHNVAAIAGMVAAMEAAAADRERVATTAGAARDRLEDDLARAVPDAEFTVPRPFRLPQHAHLRIPGLRADTVLVRLDQAGIAASAGSACHSGAVEASHVLTAMGLPAAAAPEYLRFSFGWTSEVEHGAAAAAALAALAEELR